MMDSPLIALSFQAVLLMASKYEIRVDSVLIRIRPPTQNASLTKEEYRKVPTEETRKVTVDGRSTDQTTWILYYD